MPSAANIVIADAQGTPVNHTFLPIGLDKDGTFWYQDQSQATAVGYWQISVRVKRPIAAQAGVSSDGRVYRVQIGLHEPVLANITNSTVSGVAPAPQVAYIPRGLVEYLLPERTALIDRQNMSKMLPLLLQNAQIKSVVENLEFLY